MADLMAAWLEYYSGTRLAVPMVVNLGGHSEMMKVALRALMLGQAKEPVLPVQPLLLKVVLEQLISLVAFYFPFLIAYL